ncbi:MAG: DNA-directed RNA polymerase subunit L [Candidatus Methanoplasma sp.]|jgi:DNA-directed RNA polymerase subunit L|nr:DNA-directed RNA polymerase subunit L [Candidatus Methanoplasma sp.]
MAVYTVEKTDKTITLGFSEDDPTLIELMIKALNDDKSVVMVRYVNQHPELSDIVLRVEVSGGRPEEAVKNASKAVSAYFAAVKQ